MSGSSEWIMVRVTRDTHTDLMGCKARYESERNAGRPVGNVQVDRFGLSINSVVAELIRRDVSHGSRSRKAAQKRREASRVRREENAASKAATQSSE